MDYEQRHLPALEKTANEVQRAAQECIEVCALGSWTTRYQGLNADQLRDRLAAIAESLRIQKAAQRTVKRFVDGADTHDRAQHILAQLAREIRAILPDTLGATDVEVDDE